MMRFPFPLSTLLWSALLLTATVGCQSHDQPAAGAAAPATQRVTDDVGHQLTIPARPRRIMSLAASMTEMLFAVADTATIVARTQVCDYPKAALRKQVISSYPLDLEGLVALHPDVVFTTEGITSLDDIARLEKLGIPVYCQRYTSVEDVLRGITDLGRLLNRPAPARHLTDSLRTALRAVEQLPRPGRPPAVLAITWQDPIYVYGENTLFTDKIRRAGGRNAVTEHFAQPYPALTREYILKLNPEVLIGGSFGKLDSTFFKAYPELKRIKAYQNHRVYAVTGDLMERPSPRVVESVRELQRLIWAPPAP
ncbi:iron ABC transporter substrate-binding protein [Hymenobacter aquaticus]|uniref:Iron ABC transporter substrate-binding protein n=1 Tax=Hymenobacter aquaticus TaxID=1867101 RepID=A0A4Z0PYE9_9BACT|nr:helical backbone metal receptor [Hymenobacter aquaticus]TGE22465.1 iron ABC transporter substrate-binding protein [Hymenobacter aquaticus]